MENVCSELQTWLRMRKVHLLILSEIRIVPKRFLGVTELTFNEIPPVSNHRKVV